MNRLWGYMRRLPSLLTMLCFLCLGAVPAQAADVTNSAEVEAFVDGVVKPVMQKEHSPSGVVTVMKDGEIVFAKGYGYIDVEKRIPVDPDTSMFRPGSISKLFTWLSVMQLYELGKLDLDTDVNTYLTQFKVKDTFPGQPITLRHIMTHTTGFEDGGFGYLILNDPARLMPLSDSLEKYQPERIVPPGTRVAYSNWATALAGLIVENISGSNFNKYVQTHFFEPLGMTHSTFVEPLPAELEPFMAKAYAYKAGKYKKLKYEIIGNFGPAGASAVSALDMTKFARALLNGGELDGKRILKAETLQKMLDEGFVHDDRLRGMGLGFIKRQYGTEGLNVYGHDGGTTIFLSHFGLSQSENFMLFSSFSGPGGAAVHSAFVKNFYDEFFPRELPYIEPPIDFQERGKKYEGIYVQSRSNFSKIESIGRALNGLEVALMPDNTLLIHNDRYVEIDENLFRQVNDNRRIAFQENEDGSIAGFVFDGLGVTYMYPAAFYEAKGYVMLCVGLSLLAFILVFVRLWLQWARYRAFTGFEKAAYRASIAIAGTNLLFFTFVGFGLQGGILSLYYAIPLPIKVALIFPIIAVFAVGYHLYTTYKVWQQGAFENRWARVRHTLVSLFGLWMLTFYYTWNFIGFNYL